MSHEYNIRDNRVISQEPIVGGVYTARKVAGKGCVYISGDQAQAVGTFQYAGNGKWIDIKKVEFVELPEHELLDFVRTEKVLHVKTDTEKQKKRS